MKLIKLSEIHYIIVDDSEIKENQWYYNNKVLFLSDNKFDEGNNPNHNKNNKLVTHSIEPLGTKINGVDFWTSDLMPISLSEVEEAIYGYSIYQKALDFAITSKIYIDDEKTHNEVAESLISFHKELIKDKLIIDIGKFKRIAYAFFSLHQSNNFDNDELELEFKRILKNNIQLLTQSLLPKTEWEVEFDEQGKLKLV